MPWWRRWDGSADGSRRGAVPRRAELAGEPVNTQVRVEIPAQVDRRSRALPTPLTTQRIAGSLRRLGIRCLTDESGSLLAMWERHMVLFALEGPEQEILVMRARAYGTLPTDWAGRAHAALNEWNHTRRFLKSYVGEPTEKGRLSLYAEMQVPLVPGAHDALLDELVDCAAAVSGSWVDWLHDEGGLL
ncbi:MAG TPA: YbjN domain-containing protein [Micromonosporaceae bacterium]